MRTFRILQVSDLGVSFKKDRVALVAVSFWLFFLFSSIFYLLIYFPNLPVSIPLFFSRSWGEPQLAQKIYLWVLPVGNLFLGVVNVSFAISLHRSNQFLSRILLAITPIISLLSALSVINIINLVK